MIIIILIAYITIVFTENTREKQVESSPKVNNDNIVKVSKSNTQVSSPVGYTKEVETIIGETSSDSIELFDENLRFRLMKYSLISASFLTLKEINSSNVIVTAIISKLYKGFGEMIDPLKKPSLGDLNSVVRISLADLNFEDKGEFLRLMKEPTQLLFEVISNEDYSINSKIEFDDEATMIEVRSIMSGLFGVRLSENEISIILNNTYNYS